MLRLRSTAVLTLLLIGLAGCAAPWSRLQPIGEAGNQPYQLGPGDRIRVTVQGVEAASIDYTVSDTGNISMPLIGIVKVGGLTPHEVEAQIAARATEEQIRGNPSTTVEVEQYRPFFILGEVQRPGLYPYTPGMTVRTAVAIAGGYTFRAEEDHVAITRTVGGGKPVEGQASPSTAVQPNDTIYVYESWF
jgi:polysaccharide export outer membrane protein